MTDNQYAKHVITRIEIMHNDDVRYLVSESAGFSFSLQLMARDIQLAYKLTMAF